MGDSEDWVMRPAVERVCRYESLRDGTLDLEDVARMNDALDVRDINRDKYREASE